MNLMDDCSHCLSAVQSARRCWEKLAGLQGRAGEQQGAKEAGSGITELAAMAETLPSMSGLAVTKPPPAAGMTSLSTPFQPSWQSYHTRALVPTQESKATGLFHPQGRRRPKPRAPTMLSRWRLRLRPHEFTHLSRAPVAETRVVPRSQARREMPASSTAMMPVRKMPSKVPAPPIDATGAPSPRTASRLRRSAPISVPRLPLT